MITVSLETAKKLKEAGFNKICFCKLMLSGNEGIYCSDRNKDERIFAPTAQEILDELPTVIEVGRIEYMLTMTKKSALYLDVDIGDNCHTRATVIMFDGENLVEALALLRIRCKDNGYLSS